MTAIDPADDLDGVDVGGGTGDDDVELVECVLLYDERLAPTSPADRQGAVAVAEIDR